MASGTFGIVERLAGRTEKIDAAADQDKKQTSSPTIKPTPPKRSALDNSAKAGSTSKTLPASNAAMGILRDMGESEFSEVLNSLVRVSWAMASGNTPLSSTSIVKVISIFVYLTDFLNGGLLVDYLNRQGNYYYVCVIIINLWDHL